MLHQLLRRLAQNQFLLRQGEEKRRAGFRLLRARLCNFFGVDVNECDRRLRAIQFRIVRCRENDATTIGEQLDRCFVPEATHSSGQSFLGDCLQRPMQREEVGIAGEKRSAIGRR